MKSFTVAIRWAGAPNSSAFSVVARATARMPARRAASMPRGASSNTRQRAGGVPPTSRQSPSTGLLATGTYAQNALLSYTIDGNLRGDGWSAWAAFLGNWTTATGANGASLGLSNVLSYGVVVQGGFFVTNELELAARYEGLWVASGNRTFGAVTGSLLDQTLNIVTLGANWYLDQNDLKISLDGGWAFEPVLFSNGLYGDNVSGTDWRASQTEIGRAHV